MLTLDLGGEVAMAEATIRHLTSPAFVTGVAAGAACAALYVRLFPLSVKVVKSVYNLSIRKLNC